MKDKLNEIMNKEYDALQKMLILLEQQYDLYIKKDIFGLEKIVEKIEKQNVEIARAEMERRKLVGSNSMKQLVFSFQDSALEDNFRRVKLLLENLKHQKETNSLLIKQGLVFTNKMLAVLSPKRNANVYNNSGKITK